MARLDIPEPVVERPRGPRRIIVISPHNAWTCASCGDTGDFRRMDKARRIARSSMSARRTPNNRAHCDGQAAFRLARLSATTAFAQVNRHSERSLISDNVGLSPQVGGLSREGGHDAGCPDRCFASPKFNSLLARAE
jgi:hypothetical protein